MLMATFNERRTASISCIRILSAASGTGRAHRVGVSGSEIFHPRYGVLLSGSDKSIRSSGKALGAWTDEKAPLSSRVLHPNHGLPDR